MKRGQPKTQANLPIAALAALLVFVTTADPAASAPGIPRNPGIREIANTVMLTGTSTGPVIASCPPGEVALGGGWNVPPRARVFAAVLNGNSWAVSVANAAGEVTAYVECVYGVAGLVVTSRATEFSVQANSPQAGAMMCNSNEYPVGFGFDLGGSSANIWLQSNFPATILGPVIWLIYALNQDSVAHSASVSIQCLTASAALSPPLYLQATGGVVSAATTGSVTAQCPSGMQVAGGGLAISSASGGIADPYLLHATNGGWQGSISGVTGSVLTLFVPTANAICLGLPDMRPPRPPNALPR